MTLKLCTHVAANEKQTDEAVRALGTWLYEYSAMFDYKVTAMADARKIAAEMIKEADECFQIKKEELHALMEKAYREGYHNGQGDIAEDREACWQRSNTLKALLESEAEREGK